ncbi:MAG: carbamate kinase [Candidatus Dormibacteria bacterium]
MARIAVIALGGNAFTRAGQAGTYEEQEANAQGMARSVMALLRSGWGVVIVHGNGPQVGSLAIAHEESAGVIPSQPLFNLGAMTQGQMGSLISLALRRVSGWPRVRPAALVTHVTVDPADPAFGHPTKPIGPFLERAEAEGLAAARGWSIVEDSGRGYRRVVPSPEPIDILEAGAILALVDAGFVVVAAGGGGVAVVSGPDGYRGVDAVIDKDYAAQRLATSLEAEALVLVTGVEAVMLDFGTPAQRAVEEMSLEEAERHLGEGQFPPGSMGPKMRAATRFLRAGGRVAVITTPELVYPSLEGRASLLEGRAGTSILGHPRAEIPLAAEASALVGP